ncbi:hypothetical protein OIX85_003892 [Vibrio parahaemolyticus]|uniref:hypothetical protein n=1 Tax=Vibrio alginolyticus TaxID=663 RepID=UPI0035C6EE42|nr:hypothetical protein [Vibrio parahaemolyticus]
MLGGMTFSNGNNSSQLYEREDAFIDIVKPLLSLVDACAPSEPPKPIVNFGKPQKGRYVQPTPEELAEKRKWEATLKEIKKDEEAINPRNPVKCKRKDGKTFIRLPWEEWEEYCLTKFVDYMTPEEVAASLQRPVRGVKNKASSMGLVWKYTSDKAKRRHQQRKANVLPAKEDSRAEACLVEYVNTLEPIKSWDKEAPSFLPSRRNKKTSRQVARTS